MIKPKAFQLVAVALAAGMLIGAAADRELSSAELRDLSPKAANRQFQRDLLSILRPMERYPRGMLRLMGDVGADTRAVATDYAPLCQRDTLSLVYEPSEREGAYEDWLVKPASLTAERTYRFIAAPKPGDIEAIDREDHVRLVFDRKCRAAEKPEGDGEWYGWFKADSPEEAMDGGFAMLAVQEWAARNGNRFSSCDSEANSQDCNEEAVSKLSLDNIRKVETCKPGAAQEICIQLGDYGMTYTIHARDTGKPMQAADIIWVAFQQQIVVT